MAASVSALGIEAEGVLSSRDFPERPRVTVWTLEQVIEVLDEAGAGEWVAEVRERYVARP